MNQLLLVEDDENLAHSVQAYLRKEGFQVSLANDIGSARSFLEASLPSLVILDWMLPDGQGIDFLKDLRFVHPSLPVVLLTARTELIDRVLGLEAGANDYIIKPFEPRELLARIRVQLRNVAKPPSKNELRSEPLKLDVPGRMAIFRGNPVTLSKMEFDLLKVFVENPKRVFSRLELLDQVWGYNSYPTTRTVDMHVLALRQKFDERLFETVRGVGYRYDPVKFLEAC